MSYELTKRLLRHEADLTILLSGLRASRNLEEANETLEACGIDVIALPAIMREIEDARRIGARNAIIDAAFERLTPTTETDGKVRRYANGIRRKLT